MTVLVEGPEWRLVAGMLPWVEREWLSVWELRPDMQLRWSMKRTARPLLGATMNSWRGSIPPNTL